MFEILSTSDIITIVGIIITIAGAIIGISGLIGRHKIAYKVKQKNKSKNNTFNQAQNISITNNNIYQTPTESISRNVITVTQETNIYGNPAMKGCFEFNYSNNNGTYLIGENDFVFTTKWSKASDTSIHAYSDGNDIDSIALLKSPIKLDDINNIKGDFTSRCRTPLIGDAVVWRNVKGKHMVTKILEIDDDTRGSKSDRLKCEFIILCQ